MLKKFSVFIGSILLSLLAGGIGSLASITNIPTWYRTLDKPPLNPPDWLFGPVWTTLYVLMGISLALVILSKHDGKNRAYTWFGLQLVLNTLWSFVFFGLQLPWLAVFVIVGLFASIVLTMKEFRRFVPVTFWLLLPYIAWVSFAAYLNIGIATLNW